MHEVDTISFTDEETEFQSRKVACPKSHSLTSLGQSKQSNSRIMGSGLSDSLYKSSMNALEFVAPVPEIVLGK